MLLLIPGYTHKSHGSVLLDFAAGLIRYQATVGHDVVECQVDAVDEQGTYVHNSVSGVSMVTCSHCFCQCFCSEVLKKLI